MGGFPASPTTAPFSSLPGCTEDTMIVFFFSIPRNRTQRVNMSEVEEARGMGRSSWGWQNGVKNALKGQNLNMQEGARCAWYTADNMLSMG